MKAVVSTIVMSLLLSGCADAFLDRAERREMISAVPSAQVHDDVATLAEASLKSKRLAYTYVQAARNVSTFQDVTAAAVILSAGATAYGIATDASGAAIADRALPGVVIGLTGRRYANRDTIAAIYAGAQRLNCISAKAGIAASLGELSDLGVERPALVATRSTMLDAQIITRADIIRDNVEFRSILDEFNGGIRGETASGGDEQTARKAALIEYIGELEKCIEIEMTKSDTTGRKNTGVNYDIPPREPEDEGMVEF